MGPTPDRLPPGPLTYEDYVELPDDGKQYEILDGELFVSPAPVPRHQAVSRNLLILLGSFVKSRRLGTIFDAPIDLILSQTTIAQPDLIFIRVGRERIITDRAIEGPPDLTIEILSPSSNRKDRTTKAGLYARFGIAWYWIFDPIERTMGMYELEGDAYRCVGVAAGDSIVTSPLFPGLEIRLADVWD